MQVGIKKGSLMRRLVTLAVSADLRVQKITDFIDGDGHFELRVSTPELASRPITRSVLVYRSRTGSLVGMSGAPVTIAQAERLIAVYMRDPDRPMWQLMHAAGIDHVTGADVNPIRTESEPTAEPTGPAADTEATR